MLRVIENQDFSVIFSCLFIVIGVVLLGVSFIYYLFIPYPNTLIRNLGYGGIISFGIATIIFLIPIFREKSERV